MGLIRVKWIIKPWGNEMIWAQTDKYVGKIICIKEGQQLSLQYHKQKDETIYVKEGMLKVRIKKDGKFQCFHLEEGASFRIPPNTIHQFSAYPNKGPVFLFEVSTPELDDVVRLEDNYGRV